jgi:hypothetical protein
MSDAAEMDPQILQQLGRQAAEAVAGAEAVEDMEVGPALDWDGTPAYLFTFLINQDKSIARPGEILIRTGLKIQDELISRGDEHNPMIRLLDRADWEQRAGA